MKKVNGEYRPIVVLPCIIKRNKVEFLGSDEKFVIRGEDVCSFLEELLPHCNGNESIYDIAEEYAGYNAKCETMKYFADEEALQENFERVYPKIRDAVDRLAEVGAVVDSREQYWHFHKLTNYPSTFLQDLTGDEIAKHHDDWEDVRDLIRKHDVLVPGNWGSERRSRRDQTIPELLNRSSCRNFSKKKIPAVVDLLYVCNAAYGYIDDEKRKRPVPSAGDLYPLKLYVVSDVRGCYEYNPDNNTLVRYKFPNPEHLKFCFNSEDFMGASFHIIITGNLDAQGFKYANRAYRFCLIEAGHVAQNITTFAESMGLKTCELGGVLDDAISEELELYEGYVPLLAIAIGYENEEPKRDEIDYVEFVEKNTGEDKPVKFCNVWSDDGSMWTAIAGYEDHGEKCVGTGAARSYDYAAFKAVVEAYERYTAFSVDDHERPDNSSGIAAHFSLREAQKAALAELIERDAIMRLWNSKISPNHVARSTWSVNVVRRANYWESKGRKVSVLNLPSKYAPVVLVTITSNEYPYFVCGAASSSNGMVGECKNSIAVFQSMIEKALMEAEVSLCYFLNNPEPGRAPRPEDVCTPEDHGKFYRKNRNAVEKLAWLTSNKSNKILFSGWDYSFEQLIEMLHVEMEVLGELDNGLIVVKLTSPDLKPMTFGTEKSSELPHFFA